MILRVSFYLNVWRAFFIKRFHEDDLILNFGALLTANIIKKKFLCNSNLNNPKHKIFVVVNKTNYFLPCKNIQIHHVFKTFHSPIIHMVIFSTRSNIFIFQYYAMTWFKGNLFVGVTAITGFVVFVAVKIACPYMLDMLLN